MESETCNNCDAKIYPKAIFCHKCGDRLKCENCGAFLVKDANNCISCGTKITHINNPNGSAKNTVTYRRTKDETFFDASLSDDVAKDGIGNLIASITNNRLPGQNFPNKEINGFADSTSEDSSDTVDIDSEEIVEQVNSKDTSNDFPHISDVEMTVNCSEPEWILIYAFYESNFAKRPFTKDAVYERYMSKRKSRSHLANFSKNWKSLFKQYFSTISDSAIKFRGDNLTHLQNLILNKEKGSVRSVSKSGNGKKRTPNEGTEDTQKDTNEKQQTKVKNKGSSGQNYSLLPDLNLHPKGKPSLKDFFAQYKPANVPESILIMIYYLEKILKQDNINMNAIYTCYKNIGLPVPMIDLALANIHSRHGWINTSNRSNLKVSIAGENHIEHQMKKKSSGNN